ncbi:MAG: hypothetical protein IJY83_02930 [Oscillospiraceae bacterium]|nr:hypothetical protein [Oscillospiraceae bacterium]
MRRRNLIKTLCCFSATAVLLMSSVQKINADETIEIDVSVDTSLDRKAISRYIYGINDTASLSGVRATALNQTGNDFMTYNWENNYSNAGESYLAANRDVIADRYNRQSSDPAVAADGLITTANHNHIDFTIASLPTIGYVAADAYGPLLNSEVAPSDRWVKTYTNKSGEYLLSPDKNDDAVYIDEYLNYIINYYGKSAFGGISAYSVGGDSFAWSKEFPLASDNFTVEDYMQRTLDMAEMVKKADSNALVIGGGFNSIDSCASFAENAGWSKYKNDYSWFVDFYLDEMNKAAQQNGKRLIDIIDVKYFPEEKTEYGISIISETSDEANKMRIQAVRALWDGSYSKEGENKEFFPLLPTFQASINEYYPGTKLALTEYNFGGGNSVAGGIAQVEALGCFAEEGVFLACLSPDKDDDTTYQYSAINLFTNYDGNGGEFGDVSVRAENDNTELCSSFAAIDNEGVLNVVLTNKSDTLTETVNIDISSEYRYSFAETYGFSFGKPEITKGMSHSLSGNYLTIELKPYSVVLISFKPMLTFEQKPEETSAVTSVVTETPPEETSSSEEISLGETTTDENAEKEGNTNIIPLLKIGAVLFGVLTAIGMIYLFVNELRNKKEE